MPKYAIMNILTRQKERHKMKLKRRVADYGYTSQTRKRPGIVIRNQTEQNFVDKVKECHSFLNTHLQLNSNLNIERHLAWGHDTWYAGYYCQDDNLVNINFERCYGFSLKDIMKVLCHEMRHAYQHDKGWFGDPNSDRFRFVRRQTSRGRIETDYWKGKKYDRWAYKDCPWEVDARAHEDKYYALLEKAGLITKEQSVWAMPGDKHQKVDYTEFSEIIRKKYQSESTQKFVAYVLSPEERKAKRKAVLQKYIPLIKAVGYDYNEKKNKWEPNDNYTQKNAKKLNDLWKKYKKEMKHEQRKDGDVVVGINELPKQYTRWTRKALDYYWANEEQFTTNFIAYPKYNLTFRDLTC
jgi:hypothetical protein